MTHRYVIIGGGAIGMQLAGRLTLAGLNALLITRGAQYQALSTAPLHLHHPQGTDQVQIAVANSPEAARLTRNDILVVATKTQDVEQVVTQWAWQPLEGDTSGAPGALAADLPIVILQNGTAAEDIARRRFSQVISVASIVPVSYLEPGHVTSRAAPKNGYFQLGRLTGASLPTDDTLAQIAGDFEAAGFVTRIRDNITARKYEKLLFNATNAVDVFEGTADERRALTAALTAETRAILSAAGVNLDLGAPDVDIAVELGTNRVPAGNTNSAAQRSTWQSFARGKPSEVDYLNGDIVLLARQHGLDAPLNARVQRLLGLAQTLGEAPQTRHIRDVLLKD
ncbi:Ketopantoate reductase ApbA/PanE domain protein (plasmid) [Ketogulonicigenium vulgare Y25]|nr:2-dehydropantoate 2-reductase N-terminal domain-containing protein [Ketogulonicigenium vulgare]ADO44303.1 Ketopantoate reductase ApbA/PanE domain protein [Ketogulonicigenium vulgare Y25]